MKAIVRIVAVVLGAILLAGCATPQIDWKARIGIYTYDQAVQDYGPPERSAKLSDGSTVAEWLVRRGTVVYSAEPPLYPPPGYWGPMWGGYSTTYFPARFIRLTFDPSGKLKAEKEFSK